MQNPVNYFSEIEDPRIDHTKEHLLEDIIFITIAAVICGAETWNDIEDYGKSKEDWLGQYLQLPNGIPSHDTFNRLFSALDPSQLETCFLNWVRDATRLSHGEVVSIDGKAIRGSREKGSKSFVHMVSAWANLNGISLGQVKVDDKSNEITAIPKLQEVLALKGCIVTIDAMGCQRNIAERIISQQADYILAVKGNQGNLESDIESSMCFSKPVSQWVEEDFGHGRIETRKCTVYDDLSFIENVEKWAGLKCIVKLDSSRYIKAESREEKQTHFYITSLAPDAQTVGKSIRRHWGIENSLHWQLDVSFGEDKSRKREGYAAQNFSVICRIALNLIKTNSQRKEASKEKT
jgi:predicted transposase YbfD/YdcC